jgi:hypothetical protein
MGIERIAALGAVPLLLFGAACSSSSSFEAKAAEDDLYTALERSGLQTCSEEDLDWKVPGFDSGKKFKIGSDCDSEDDEDNRFKVVVARFDNEAARDLAEFTATTGVRMMKHASVWTHGPYLIVLEGEKDVSDYDKAKDALKDIGAK